MPLPFSLSRRSVSPTICHAYLLPSLAEKVHSSHILVDNFSLLSIKVKLNKKRLKICLKLKSFSVVFNHICLFMSVNVNMFTYIMIGEPELIKPSSSGVSFYFY